MRVLVSGGGGQLAEALRREWTDHELVVPPEAEFDLADRDSVLQQVHAVRPEVLLNAGAYTAVDAAESDEARAERVNGTAVGWLAEVCNEVGACLVQVSTDYVFDGQDPRPRREDDPVGPRSVYGRTKGLGEMAAMSARNHLVVRTAWLYDAWGKNFLNTMLHRAEGGAALRVVNDQHGSPTSCRALARQLKVAVEGGWRGRVHMTCGGATTWFGFAQKIFSLAGMNPQLSPCSTSEYPTPAPRPRHSVLDNQLRLRLGPDVMGTWEAALEEVMAERWPLGGRHV